MCGATDHPLTEVDQRLKARVGSDRQRVGDLDVQIEALLGQRAQATARVAVAREGLPGIVARRFDGDKELATAREEWNTCIATIKDCCDRLSITDPVFVEDAAEPDAAELFAPLLRDIDSQLNEARQHLAAASRADAEAAKLATERDKIRADLDIASALVATLKADEQNTQSDLRTLNATLHNMKATVSAVLSRLQATLAPAFPDWKQEAADKGTAFPTACRDRADQWGETQRRFDTAGSEISRLQADSEGKRATLRATETAVEEAKKHHDLKRGAFDKLLADRAKVIGGRPVGEVRTEFRQRWEIAEKAWREREKARSETEKAVTTGASNVISARRAVDSMRETCTLADRALAERLHACGLNKEEAKAALKKGDDWAASEQERLDALRQAIATARATLNERQQAVTAHANGQPAQTVTEIAAALLDIEIRCAKASEEFIAASTMIHSDSQVRTRIAQLKGALDERREKARVWNQLDELIGSADGSKFRRFAQSLTFNQLIRLANRHLADLHPRYELQRAPGGDLVLQVIDHNMADEVRGVHNLSGGERFLVSLALALGLASMSSNRGITVESLFIDEGFGSLDSSSLAMAISALEQLQATGRRVGVVSHVDELKERIAVKVEVVPVGGGRCTVQVVTS